MFSVFSEMFGDSWSMFGVGIPLLEVEVTLLGVIG